MALRNLLNRGIAAARHHRKTGLFLTSMISDKTNHQVHQKRDFAIRLTDGMDDKGICFSNSQYSYNFESLSATIKAPNQHSEILDMAKFAVNEHNNNNHAEGAEKGNNLRLDAVLEAMLRFEWGVTEFDMTLRAVDDGFVDDGGGRGRDTVYKATVSKSRAGDLTLRHFYQSELCEEWPL